MRVLVVTQMWPSPATPDLGIFVSRQVDALRNLGADVIVAKTDRRRGGLLGANQYLRLARQALGAARSDRPDVVLGHFLFPAGEVGRRAARRARVPLVVTAHGTDVANIQRSLVLRRLTRRVLRDAAAVIAVSEPLARELDAASGLDTNATVIDMGVDLATFQPGDRDAATDSLGLAPQRPLVVQVGAKNVARLADAIGLVRDRRGSGELWLAGAGGDLATAGSRHVRWLGRVEPQRVPRLLLAADCCCLVSEREGYGLAAMEAAACGVPVVVSRTAPVAADLPPTAAVLVDPQSADSIADGIEAAAALNRNDPAGLAAAAAHSSELQAARVLDVLRDVAGA